MFIVSAFMFLTLLAGPANDGIFSAREFAILEPIPPEGHIMKVYRADNDDDIAVLRKVCEPVDKQTAASSEFLRLVAGMLATVNDPDNTGVGIAAPQVGINKRLIAVQRFDHEDESFGFYINPRIISASEEMVQSEEGCLSIPDARGCVRRHKSITIEYIEPEDFTLRQEEIVGFTAIIFQHEIDHLDGVLFTDKLSAPYYGEI